MTNLLSSLKRIYHREIADASALLELWSEILHMVLGVETGLPLPREARYNGSLAHFQRVLIIMHLQLRLFQIEPSEADFYSQSEAGL